MRSTPTVGTPLWVNRSYAVCSRRSRGSAFSGELMSATVGETDLSIERYRR